MGSGAGRVREVLEVRLATTRTRWPRWAGWVLAGAATVLSGVCLEAAAVELRNEVRDFTTEWARGGPQAWLATLRQHPDTAFYVAHAPEGWIVQTDIAPLMAAMNSTQPAAVVCYLASAHAVPVSTVSTVGHEAAILVEAFRRERAYPGSCSDLAAIDPAEIRRWWNRDGPKSPR